MTDAMLGFLIGQCMVNSLLLTIYLVQRIWGRNGR